MSGQVFASLTEFVWERCLAAMPKQLAVLTATYASYGHFDDDQDFFDALSASFFKWVVAVVPRVCCARLVLLPMCCAGLKRNSSLGLAAFSTLIKAVRPCPPDGTTGSCRAAACLMWR